MFDPSAFTGASTPHTIKTLQSLILGPSDINASETKRFVANWIRARNQNRVEFWVQLSDVGADEGAHGSREKKTEGFLQSTARTSCCRFEVLVIIFNIT